MLDTLYCHDLLKGEKRVCLLAGENTHVLLLNTILAIENGDYSMAIALADRGLLYDGAANFYYLKSIALARVGQIEEAAAICEEWRDYLHGMNEVVDCRCVYAIAQSNHHLDKPFMGDMQSFIRHNQYYVGGYEMLRRMMHEKGLVLETDDTEHRNLVDVFNGTDGNLTAAWRNSDVKAKQTLIRAILDYPYEN